MKPPSILKQLRNKYLTILQKEALKLIRKIYIRKLLSNYLEEVPIFYFLLITLR